MSPLLYARPMRIAWSLPLCALLLAGCAGPAGTASDMRTQVRYRGEVRGGTCETAGMCAPGSKLPPFTLSMAGGRSVTLTGSTVDLYPYIGKEVEVTGTIPGLTQRMWVEVTVEGVRAGEGV